MDNPTALPGAWSTTPPPATDGRPASPAGLLRSATVACVLAVAALTGLAVAGRASRLSAVLCLVAICCGTLTASTLRRLRRRELAAVEAALAAAVDGRWITVESGIARLEPGLAERANTTIDQLHQTVLAVVRSSEALSAGRSGIHDVSEAISTTAESTAGQAVDAADAAESVSAIVHLVASNSDELATMIGSVAEHAGNVSLVTESAVQQARAAVDTVSALAAASKEIGQVVNLINNIAGQTRMLALNATIEAVSAGDAGNGFAVVADEVRALAQATAEATGSVAKSVLDIQRGAVEAASAIETMVGTINRIGDSQSAIALAMEQQTTTTNKIERLSSEAAVGSDSIAANVIALANAARVSAAVGAQIRTTSGELAVIGDNLTAVLGQYDVNDLLAEWAALDPPKPPPTAVTRGTTTYVEDTVRGAGEAQFEYIGSGWSHSEANIDTGGSNSYDCVPDDVARLRFTGTKVRLCSVTGPNHGTAFVSVDGGEEHVVDMYSAQRCAGVKVYESPTLPHGSHVLLLRVGARKNPESRYSWVTVDRVEFEHPA